MHIVERFSQCCTIFSVNYFLEHWSLCIEEETERINDVRNDDPKSQRNGKDLESMLSSLRDTDIGNMSRLFKDMFKVPVLRPKTNTILIVNSIQSYELRHTIWSLRYFML